jgi:hypothetical protein
MIHELSLHPEVEKRLRLGSGARPPQALRRSRPAHVSYPQTCVLRPLRPAGMSHGSSDRAGAQDPFVPAKILLVADHRSWVTLSTGVRTNA